MLDRMESVQIRPRGSHGQSGEVVPQRMTFIMRLLEFPFVIAVVIACWAEPASAQAPSQVEPEKKPDPFAFADFTWLSGNPRTKEAPLDTKAFTGEFRADTNFTYTQLTFDFMPSQFVTFRSEFNDRHANVPYFSGAGGVTPPGSNTGAPGSIVPGWSPDLRKSENRVTFALLVKL